MGPSANKPSISGGAEGYLIPRAGARVRRMVSLEPPRLCLRQGCQAMPTSVGPIFGTPAALTHRIAREGLCAGTRMASMLKTMREELPPFADYSLKIVAASPVPPGWPVRPNE
jgi:hypothetical protein